MLGGLEGYGSDDSDIEAPQQTSQAQPISSPKKKSTFSLPPPTNATKAPLPPPKTKSKRPIFTVAKPSKASSDDEADGQERVTKKPRLESRKGAGSSSLLAMLPAPSKAPPVPVAPPRVLGSAASGGGGTGVIMPSSTDEVGGQELFDFKVRSTDDTETKSTVLVPPSLAKGKARVPALSKETSTAHKVPAVDFFSLGATATRSTPPASNNQAGDLPGSSTSISITSAPTVPIFEPPPPTPSDPYPGYYQLPSGQWAAYDPEFYKKRYDLWVASQSLDGNSQKGFEGAEGENTVEVDAQEQLDLARKEREEKKALTMNAGGGPEAPNMNIKAPKMGSRARTRHQLSALLTEAYENREALEERIAQGRRNRKEAGNKYGF